MVDESWFNSNTSHVTINLSSSEGEEITMCNSNTSHVTINHRAILPSAVSELKFKYISCYY